MKLSVVLSSAYVAVGMADIASLRSNDEAAISSNLGGSNEETLDCGQYTNYWTCRKLFWDMFPPDSTEPCCCVWNDNTDGDSCTFSDRDFAPEDPPNVPDGVPNQSLQTCLAGTDGVIGPDSCAYYTGTRTSGRNDNSFDTCYTINWRSTGTQCPIICAQLFNPLAMATDWGYKVYFACTIGCGYADRYVTWRTGIAMDAGIWTEEQETNRFTDRYTQADAPDVTGLPAYQEGIEDFDCETMCKRTVWNLASGNTRCNWNQGPDLNVPEVADFGAVASCRFGCLIGYDPSMGAMPYSMS